jgi:DNA-directed RNA polymerase sigma subunit (sigma70/sigma32)
LIGSSIEGGQDPIELKRSRQRHNRTRLREAGRTLERVPREQLDAILDPREQKILRLRTGIEDGRRYSFVDIAVELDLGQERIRQIQMQALKKLLGRA